MRALLYLAVVEWECASLPCGCWRGGRGGGLDREDAWVGWVGLGGEFRGWDGMG